jgi:hypothetical protein
MNTLTLTVFVSLVAGLSALHAENASLTTLAEVPASGVNIRQDSVSADPAAGLSIRYTDESQRRGATQTFVWNSTGKLTGVGLKLSAAAGDRYPLLAPQSFEVDIHELDEALNSRRITRKLATVSVTVTPQLVRPGQYLYLSFDPPLALRKGTAYGLSIRPTQLVRDSHLHLAWTGHANGSTPEAYVPGVASMTLGLPYADSDRYGREPLERDFDLVFFTTTDAEE